MVGMSVVQVANAVRHTPLLTLVSDSGPAALGHDDLAKGLDTHDTPLHVLGGFVGGGQLAWRAAGPTVEIIEPDRGTRKAAWTFGAVLHNNGAQVTSVCGVGKDPLTHVVVGVDLGGDRRPRGLVALLSLSSSRVTRAFHFEHRVTKLCMVTGGEVNVDGDTLAPELRLWRGLLVVGTAHGTLHLLDLALDLGGHKVLSDEVSPGSLVAVTTPDPNAEHTRVTALLQKCHPTMCLSDGMSYGGHFQLIGPDDNVLFEVASQQVYVAALAFFPQLASLVVGYNFGSFQIINLSTLTIDCASPYEENMPPVLSFACQEPENDPKNFVYLWLCRSWPVEAGMESSRKTGQRESHALCTMYAMNYDSKVWIEGHGLWYQGLASISPRFEFDILSGLAMKGQPVGPSRVFSALTVQLSTPSSAGSTGGPSPVADEDSGSVLEQSLCLFGWVGRVKEAGTGSLSLVHYLAVFDINQWYQAHMPSSLVLPENQLCPYMSFHLLDRVPGVSADGVLSEVVLSAVPKPGSWAQHTSHTCNDSDWFPAALSYDAHVLTSDSLMEYKCQSVQQAALAFLTSSGPAAIVNPEEAYSACVFAGLIPADQHSIPSSTSALMLEREGLLNVALEYQLVSLLVQCVVEFSEGRFTNLGCSLPSLLDWAWTRVTEIKASNDTLSLPLFDPECGMMSSDNIALLHQNLTNLTTLSTSIITTIRDHAHTNIITKQGYSELEMRVRVVRLMVLHLEAVLWFYHCGLLSPTHTEDPGDDSGVPFPGDLLSRIYRNRRTEIRKLSSSLSGSDVLMIDGLLEEAAEGSGGSLGQAWEEEGSGGSNSSGGVYPPPSLHGLLNMFLLPNVPTPTKHRIVQYLFLDLASLLSDGYVRVVEELVKYPSSFSLSPSLIKLTQAFWLLDHKDFQEGLNGLLDPLVNPCDITPWQHRRIMKAFLYQGEHARALTYANLRQPPKVDLDDIRLHLTLLLANKMVREAFHYQRAHRTTANTQDLLQHFYTGCEHQGRLESVIHLPLSPLEEAALVNYLRTSTNTSAHDYLLVYYLQRARFDDAALLQDSLRGGLGTVRKRHGARSALVHGYLTHLPDVTNRLSSAVPKKQGPETVLYKKPPPLSAHIRQFSANLKSRASAIEQHLGSPPPRTDPYTPFRSAAQRRRAYEMTDLDDYDILVTPKKKTGRDSFNVVFPSMETSPISMLEEEASGLFSPAMAKQSYLSESSHVGDSLLKVMESLFKSGRKPTTMKSRMSSTGQNISASMLSLLQTPKIKRRSRPDTRQGTDDTLTDTPQSILKVRQMVQRPLSPSAASDASVPVFPRISARKAKITAAAAAAVVEESVLSRSVDTSLTPKQLRFHLPKVEVRQHLRRKGTVRMPTPTEEEAEVEEEEEVAGEEEVMDEEEEEEEEAKMIIDSERRQTNQGIVTPRKPIHGPAFLSPTMPSHGKEETTDADLPGFLSPVTEDSVELQSRNTTLNDLFYSFEEEKESGVKGEEEENQEEEEDTVEKEDEEKEEEERADLKENGEAEDKQEEEEEDDDDDLNAESEDETEEETNEKDQGEEDLDEQQTGPETISIVSQINDVKDVIEEPGLGVQREAEVDIQERAKGPVQIERDEDSSDLAAQKEEYGAMEPGEGAMREDEGFSEEIEAPSEEGNAGEEEVMEVESDIRVKEVISGGGEVASDEVVESEKEREEVKNDFDSVTQVMEESKAEVVEEERKENLASAIVTSEKEDKNEEEEERDKDSSAPLQDKTALEEGDMGKNEEKEQINEKIYEEEEADEMCLRLESDEETPDTPTKDKSEDAYVGESKDKKEIETPKEKMDVGQSEEKKDISSERIGSDIPGGNEGNQEAEKDSEVESERVDSEMITQQVKGDEAFVVDEKNTTKMNEESDPIIEERRDEPANLNGEIDKDKTEMQVERRSTTPTKEPRLSEDTSDSQVPTDAPVTLTSLERDTVDSVRVTGSAPRPVDEDQVIVVREEDGASPPKRRRLEEREEMEEGVAVIKDHKEKEEEGVIMEEDKEIKDERTEEKDERTKEKEEKMEIVDSTTKEKTVEVAEMETENQASVPEAKDKEGLEEETEGLSGSSIPPSSPAKDPAAASNTPGQEPETSSLASSTSPQHTDEGSQEQMQRRSTRQHSVTPSRELSTPLRRSRRLSGAFTPSTVTTPLRTTRSTVTPARDEPDEVLERMTRSGRKIIQVPTPVTRTRGSPGSPLVTPRRSRRLSESRDELKDLKGVSQKLALTPENLRDDNARTPTQEEMTTTPSMTPTSLPATPRRSTRKSHTVETLQTISEDKEVVGTTSKERKTPSKDTTPRTGTRRSRRVSQSEGLETIAENAVLTPATPRGSARKRSVALEGAAESSTPQRRRSRRLSLDSSEDMKEATKAKSPARTRRLSNVSKTPQTRTPSTRKRDQESTPAKGAIAEQPSVMPGKEEGSSVARRTRRQSYSEDGSTVERGSVTSFVTSVSASPTRSTPVTSIKDSESSEEDDNTQARKQKKEDVEDITNRRKSRLVTQFKVKPGGKTNIKSIQSMKMYSMCDEGNALLDLMDSGKSNRRVSRVRRKRTADSSPPSPLIILSREEEEEDQEEQEEERVEIDTGSEEVNLEAGLDMVESDSDSTKAEDTQDTEEQQETKKQGKKELSDSVKRTMKWRENRRRIKASIASTAAEDKRTRKRKSTFKSIQSMKIKFGDTNETDPSDESSKSNRKRSSRTRKKKVETPMMTPSSPVILLRKMNQEEIDSETGSEKLYTEEAPGKKKKTPGEESETTTKSRLSSKPSSSSDTTTTLALDSGKETRVGGEESLEKEDEGEKAHIIEGITGVESKVTTTTTTTADPPLEFKFSKPKAVSSKNRALENLTSEAIDFLFSSPVAPGRTVKQQSTKATEGTSSSESEAAGGETRTKKTKTKTKTTTTKTKTTRTRRKRTTRSNQ